MATTEKMSIHRALSEVKMLDKRIPALINKLTVCAIITPVTERIDGQPIEQFKKNAVAKMDQVMDLITRRNAIKCAIVQSNAVTTVKLKSVPDRTFTVAQAIDMKNHAMQYVDDLHSVLSNQYAMLTSNFETKMAKINRDCDAYIQSVFGNANTTTINTDMVDAMEVARKNWMEKNQLSIVDPCGLKSVVEHLSATISTFSAEIDAVLSESNAITMVEVSYENRSSTGLDISTNS